MSTLRFRAVTAPDGNLESDGKYFDDLLYSRADVRAPCSDWLFGSMGKFHKVRKVARAIPKELREREFASLNRDSGANLRNEERRRGNIIPL